jgi:hypothetical protein
MIESTKDEICDRAVRLVRAHFEFLNAGNRSAARGQMFLPPGLAEKPRDIYLDTMTAMGPFTILSISVRRFEEPRKRTRGLHGSIWVDVVLSCSLGERSTFLVVWWFPETDELQISASPTELTLEKLRETGDPQNG